MVLEKSLAETVEVAKVWFFQDRFDFNFVFIFQEKNHVQHNFVLRVSQCRTSLQGIHFNWNVLWYTALTDLTWPGASWKKNSVCLWRLAIGNTWSGKREIIFSFLFYILIKHWLVTMDHTAVLWMFHLDSLKVTQ